MKKILSLLSLLIFSSFFIYADKPIVRDIQTIAGKNRNINILWTLPKNSEKQITALKVYRSKKIITEYSQIESMEPIAEIPPDSTGYTDVLSDYSYYYYAVIACIPEPYDLVLSSVNTTSTSIQIQTKKADSTVKKIEKNEKIIPEGTSRETPLPYIDFLEKKESGKISKKTTKNAKKLYDENKKSKPQLSQYFFEEDLISPNGGDDFLLFQILKETMAPRKYKDAIPQLKQLIGTNISESTQNRAIFYLGEAYYLLGDYEEAVRSFIKLQYVYPTLTKKWIDASLDNI